MKILNIHFEKHQIGWYHLITIFFLILLSQQINASHAIEKTNIDEELIACSSPEWISDKVYTKGDKVTYLGTEYEAFHWTRNQNPDSNNSQWGPWVIIGPCDGGPNTSPSVSITSPQSGTTFTVGDNISISANASDSDGAVTQVEFLVDGTVVATDTSAPYTANWNATQGSHSITTRATDNEGAVTTSSAVSITVSGGTGNQSPTINLTNPSNGATFTVGQNVSITANASDTDGNVSKVTFYVDGNILSEDLSSPYTANWTAIVGNHSLTAIAIDDDNASTTSTAIAIVVQTDTGGGNCDANQYVEDGGYVEGSQVQNEGNLYECKPWPFTGWCNGTAAAYAPGSGTYWEDAWILVGECSGGGDGEPTVSITSPGSGQTFVEGSNITINATASDSDGTIVKVEFFSDGNKLGEDTSSPYSFTISAAQTGNYSLTAKATDNDNLSTTSDPVNIRVTSSGGGTDPLPARIMNGYWHNFNNGTGVIALRDVSPNWDVINVSFAVPRFSAADGEIGFELSSDFDAINYTEAQFRSDIQLLQSQGKKIIISIGGQDGQVQLNTTLARDKFISSMIAIIENYGFDGMDIDFEGQSLSFELGDTDFRNPTTPLIVNTIDAVRSVCNHFGNDFILTMAPETFFVQLGYSFYGGISAGADRRAGAYLPLIHALRDKLTFLQVQYYNSGFITALDDQGYIPGSGPDFYVSLVDMLLKGFPITKDSSKFFPALRPDQVLIGVPATVGAGGGHIGTQGVINSLDYLINGNSFGGQYQLSQTYPGLRGVMSWSINWDKFENLSFSNAVRAYLDGLGGARVSGQSLDDKITYPKVVLFPNPIQDNVYLQFDSEMPAVYTVEFYDSTGVKVQEYNMLTADKHARLQQLDVSQLKSGVYLYTLRLPNTIHTGRIIKN